MAVRKMIGMCRERSRSLMRAAVSNPSIPGICTSRRMTANSVSSRHRRASSPDGAVTVPVQFVLRLAVDGGEEDDRDVARLLPALYLGGDLEAVHDRHLHVEQDDGELLDEQGAKYLVARCCRHDVVVERLQHLL